MRRIMRMLVGILAVAVLAMPFEGAAAGLPKQTH